MDVEVLLGTAQVAVERGDGRETSPLGIEKDGSVAGIETITPNKRNHFLIESSP